MVGIIEEIPRAPIVEISGHIKVIGFRVKIPQCLLNVHVALECQQDPGCILIVEILHHRDGGIRRDKHAVQSSEIFVRDDGIPDDPENIFIEEGWIEMAGNIVIIRGSYLVELNRFPIRHIPQDLQGV